MDACTFIQTKVFSQEWDNLNLTDDDLRELEVLIMTSPLGGKVVRGTGGLRKMRYSPASMSTGKRSGLRVCYVYFHEMDVVVLITIYKKGVQDDISAEGKRTIKKLINKIEKELSNELGK